MTGAELNETLKKVGHLEGGLMFMGKPDRWYEKPHWRCVNNHVSTMYLKSEALGDSVCLQDGCYKTVYLTFPEDKSGPIYVQSKQFGECSHDASDGKTYEPK